jgi:hypothetical protein
MQPTSIQNRLHDPTRYIGTQPSTSKNDLLILPKTHAHTPQNLATNSKAKQRAKNVQGVGIINDRNRYVQSPVKAQAPSEPGRCHVSHTTYLTASRCKHSSSLVLIKALLCRALRHYSSLCLCMRYIMCRARAGKRIPSFEKTNWRIKQFIAVCGG